MNISKFSWHNLTVEAYNKNSKAHKTVLHNMSGEIECGKLSVIMGPSGAGKTTLINTLAGVVPKKFNTQGRILIDGKERPENFSEYIGVFQQEDVCFDYYSVYDYLYFNTVGRQRSAKCADIISNINQVLTELHLSDKATHLLSDISGGERRRVMVAKELLSQKPILFFDEPTANLDSHLALSLIIYLKEFAKRTNTIVFISIHQPSETIANLFDLFIFINSGKCLYHGKYSDTENYFAEKGFKKSTKLTFIEYIFVLTANDPQFQEIELGNPEISSLMPADADKITNSAKSIRINQFKFDFRVFKELLKRNFTYDMLFEFKKNIKKLLSVFVFLVVLMSISIYFDKTIEVKVTENQLIGRKFYYFYLIFSISTFGIQEFYRKMLDLSNLYCTEVKNNCYTPIEFILALFCYGFLETLILWIIRLIPFLIVFGELYKPTTLIFISVPAILLCTHLLLLISMVIKNGISVSLFNILQIFLVLVHPLIYYVNTYNTKSMYLLTIVLNIFSNLFLLTPLVNLLIYSSIKTFLPWWANDNISKIKPNLQLNPKNWFERCVIAASKYLDYVFEGSDKIWLKFYVLAVFIYLVWSAFFAVYRMKKMFCIHTRYKLEK